MPNFYGSFGDDDIWEPIPIPPRPTVSEPVHVYTSTGPTIDWSAIRPMGSVRSRYEPLPDLDFMQRAERNDSMPAPFRGFNFEHVMTEFRHGDRIRYHERDNWDGPMRNGCLGTIMDFDEDRVGVCYDDPFDGGHDLHGRCESRRGWYTNPDELELIGENTGYTPVSRCTRCGTSNNVSFIDGVCLCRSCQPQFSFICADCGQRHLTRRRMRGSSNICRPCFDERWYRCEFCHGVLRRGDETRVQDIVSCPRCAAEQLRTCSRCGESCLAINQIPSTSAAAASLCRECMNVMYPVCEYCHDRTPVSDLTEIYALRNGPTRPPTVMRVCNRCINHESRSCEICNRRFLTGHLNRVNTRPNGPSRIMCRECENSIAPRCEVCSTRVYDGSLVRIGEHQYCRICAEDAQYGFNGCASGDQFTWYPPTGIVSYGYKPDPILFPRKDKENPIYYGFELEVDGFREDYDDSEVYDEDHDDDDDDDDDDDAQFHRGPHAVANEVNEELGYTYIKHDGSLNNGMEIVTHPAHIDYHTITKRQNWIDTLKRLRERGLKSHDAGTCGLHVHVSSAPLEHSGGDVIEKLIFIWSKHWDNFLKFSRRNGEECRRWANKTEADVTSDMTDESAIAFLKNVKADSTGARYRAINLCPRHTIEFRIFRGTLRPETLFATLQLVDVIVKKAMSCTFAELRDMSWDDLVRSDYEDLNTYLASRQLVPTDRNTLREDSDGAVTLPPLPTTNNAAMAA